MFDQKTINALATIRLYAAGQNRDVRQAFNTLDNAGVFAALDEQTDYASAEDILAEAAAGWFCTCGDPGTSPCIIKGHQSRCTCGQADESHPSLHAGTCAVWSLHHGLEAHPLGHLTGGSGRHAAPRVDEPLYGEAAARVARELNQRNDGHWAADRLISTQGEDLTEAYSEQDRAE